MSNPDKLSTCSVDFSFPTLFNLRLEYLLSLHVANAPFTLALHSLLMGHKRLCLMDDNSGRRSLLWDVTTERMWDVRRRCGVNGRCHWCHALTSRPKARALISGNDCKANTNKRFQCFRVSREKVELCFYFIYLFSVLGNTLFIFNFFFFLETVRTDLVFVSWWQLYLYVLHDWSKMKTAYVILLIQSNK